MSRPWVPRVLGAVLIGGLLIGLTQFCLALLQAVLHPPVAVGEVAPPFEGELLDGGATDREALRGQVVLLDFWMTTCIGCVGATPKHNRLAERYAEKGLVVLGINGDDSEALEAVRSYVDTRPVRYPTLLDPSGKVSSAFGVKAYPSNILLDRSGRVVFHDSGPIPERHLIRAIESLIQL